MFQNYSNAFYFWSDQVYSHDIFGVVSSRRYQGGGLFSLGNKNKKTIIKVNKGWLKNYIG